MVAREAVAGLRIDCGAIPSDAGNLTGRIGLAEIKDRQSCGTASTADVVSVAAIARVAPGAGYTIGAQQLRKDRRRRCLVAKRTWQKPVPMGEIRTGAGETGTALN